MGKTAIDKAGKPGHSGATGWEALLPLDWNRLRELTNEPVPYHLKRWWFSLGGTPAYLFFIQLTTGLLLTFYYQPGAEGAFESMERITYTVPFGWFIRGIHKWSANLMIITVILHMLRVFFTRAYRHPRAFNWVFGVALLGLTLTFGFTGYSLVYEQLSFWGATVASNLTESVPIIGPPMATFIRGGAEVGPATMMRLFILHVGVLPAVLIGVLGLHLTFVRLHGVTEYEFDTSDDVVERAGSAGSIIPKLFALVAAAAAALALWSAVTGKPAFDFLGYNFMPGTSRTLFAIMGAALGAGAYGLWNRHLAGLLLFLAGTVLALGKLVRDLLLGESSSPGLWLVLALGLVAFVLIAVAFHRRFSDGGKTDEPKHFNFFPDHMLSELMIGTGLLALLTLLTLLFPTELGEKANPFVTPEHIKPEWYFYFQFRLLKLTSLGTSVVLTGLMMLILFTWPWIDSFIEKLAPRKELPIYIGIVGFLWFLAFTVWEAMVH